MPAGFPDGLYLRVGEGGLVRLPAVASPADDGVPPDDHAAHRHLAVCRGLPRQGQRFVHKIGVLHDDPSFDSV